MRILKCVSALLLLSFATLISTPAAEKEWLAYFGTYTGKKSKGIYVARFNPKTGQLSAPELAAETISPSFLAVHPKGKWLYAVNEVDNFSGKKGGGVSGFAIDAKSGKLTPLNHQSTGGGAPCHVSLDESGRVVLVANYSGGSVASYSVDKKGFLSTDVSFIQHQGSSVNRARQQAPHGHAIVVDPGNKFALACDLGLDKVLIYKLNTKKGTLTPNDPPFGRVAAGSGPRHIAFHPSGTFAWVINEMVCTVTSFSFDPKRGEMQELQTLSTLPANTKMIGAYSTAEILTHPSGKFVYGSNRGHDTLAVYAVDEKQGTLTLLENVSTEGKTPRSFGIDPSGRWLLAANQSSDTVVVFAIDPATGKLKPTGQSIEVGSPVSVVFAPAR
jgi:6-phosphogluconolactonase